MNDDAKTILAEIIKGHIQANELAAAKAVYFAAIKVIQATENPHFVDIKINVFYANCGMTIDILKGNQPTRN